MPTDYAFPPSNSYPITTQPQRIAVPNAEPFDDHIGRLLSQDFANLLGDGVGSLR